MQLHPWSCCKNIRFGGLGLEPRKKPSQTGLKYLSCFFELGHHFEEAV
jgi:hypothetical protein